MRTAYLDCFAGISGDMLLGALLGAGVPLSALEEAVAALGLDASLRIEVVDRSGISSIKVHVLENGLPAEGAVPHSHSHQESHTHGHTHEHTHEPEHKHTHQQEAGPALREHPHDHRHEHPHTHRHEPEHSHDHPSPQEHQHAHAPGKPHVHGRSLTGIRELIQAAALPEKVTRRAIETFTLLGHSEAKIHNVLVEEIHFHEVGAVDAIVDIVAACAGVAYLEEQGPLEWVASPVNVGGGMVVCAHGTFPVPAPATADLLRGVPTYSAHIEKELVTPTGAALLRALAPRFGPQPAMTVESIGYGAGSRNPRDFPNVLRLSLGEASGSAMVRSEPAKTAATHGHTGESVTVLETALDDATPQVLAHVAERALAGRALDVMLTPVIMKKGRPGTLITILCNGEQATTMEELLLRETSTLGVRMRREHRTCLDRHHATVATQFGEVRVKVGTREGEELNAMPEFEDCKAAALTHGVAVKQVMQAAVAVYSGRSRN